MAPREIMRGAQICTSTRRKKRSPMHDLFFLCFRPSFSPLFDFVRIQYTATTRIIVSPLFIYLFVLEPTCTWLHDYIPFIVIVGTLCLRTTTIHPLPALLHYTAPSLPCYSTRIQLAGGSNE
ncbi:hypothetical protein BYT27DRAFT_6656498 [Phlegmacium glaucopus]|nr:hypothetical protein BYT27DRAFT_6656498 [Phlegmacium glaucopus]